MLQETDYRRLSLLLGAVFIAESLFYAILPPIIPQIAREAHMTAPEVGLLAGAYPAGIIVASASSVALVTRAGLQRVTQLGAFLLAVPTLAFAWSDAGVVLDTARFVQGLGGGFVWAAGLSWLTSSARSGRTGTIVGGSVGAGMIGLLLGPVLGALAASVGRGPVFTVLAAVLLVVGLALPHSPRIADRPVGQATGILQALRNPGVVGGGILLLATGVVSATGASLVPLLISGREGSPAVIASVFVFSAVLGAVWSLILGRAVDISGGYAPMLIGFLLAGVLLAVTPLIGRVELLVVPAIVALSVLYGLWTPIGARMITSTAGHAAEHAGAVAIMNASWALGASLGALAVTHLEAFAGFEPAFMGVGVVCAIAGLTGAVVDRRIRRSPSSPSRIDREGTGMGREQ